MPTPADDQRVTKEFFREGHVVRVEGYESAIQFWRALDPIDSRWTGPEERECGWLFRGQADAAWPLLPAAWREQGPAADVMRAVKERVRREYGSHEPEAWELQRRAQGAVLMDFVHVAERDGYVLPPGTPTRGTGPEPEHEVTTLAQHYRVPTALLDFTRAPLVAMYWAAGDAPVTATHLAVWALRRTGLAQVRLHSHARARNQNLLAQDGVTVEIGMADHFMRATGRLPSLEEVRGVPEDALVKLTLPRTEVPELRRLLEIQGVTASRLTPGYYGVVETVIARYRR